MRRKSLPRGPVAAALAIVVLLAASVISTGIASARGANGILAPGNAAVTGFSGVKIPAASARGTGPADLPEIDLSGPSVHVADVQCPQGETLVDGTCCPPGRICRQFQRQRCGQGETLVNGACVPNSQPLQRQRCGQGQTMVNGTCVPDSQPLQPQRCAPGEILVNGTCRPLPPRCGQDETLVNGMCVPNSEQLPRQKCPQGETLVNGTCKPPPPRCGQGQTLVNGICQPVSRRNYWRVHRPRREPAHIQLRMSHRSAVARQRVRQHWPHSTGNGVRRR